MLISDVSSTSRPAMTKMLSYVEQTIGTNLLIDSDRESNKSDDSDTAKQQNMFVWNPKYEKWHECMVAFSPPCLHLTEYEDFRLEVNKTQLLHLNQRWFHGSLSRREARVILQDFNGGNGSFLVRTSESYRGKFAISFVHETRVKHVVIESKFDPVTGILYHITPSGPFFPSLYELIEEAQRKPLIQNHMFDIKLEQCPPKPDIRWLHRGVKSLSQAEQILRKEHRDGAFFVYRTQSDYAPYIVAYRSNGSILHNLIVASQHPSVGYTLNNVTSHVLYKIIHYFMENPINESTVLKYPVPDAEPIYTNCGIAIKDYIGDREKNELTFTVGALVTNVHNKSADWALGDHRGDKQKYFRPDHVQLLTRDELTYINDLRVSWCPSNKESSELFTDDQPTQHLASLDLQSDYRVQFSTEGNSTTILVEPANEMIKNFRSFKLSCPSDEDLEAWYRLLQRSKCLPNSIHEAQNYSKPDKRTGCVIS